jgi:hypothetical protein
MKSKQDPKQLQRCFILIDLLIQELDSVTEKHTPIAKTLREKLGSAQDTLLELYEDVYIKGNIGRTSFFQILQNKFNYNIEMLEKKLTK